MNKLYYSWQNLETDCRHLANDIKKDKVQYKQIIAITRGGLFVAGILSQFLNRVPIETISIHSYENKKRKDIKILNEKSSNEPTIICDDVVDSGITAKEVKIRYPNSKIVVLHYKSINKPVIKPDYFMEDTSDWIIYPWEINEKQND